MIVSNNFCEMMLQIYPDQVLMGPDRDEDDVDIDPIMAATFQTAMEDFCTDAEILRNGLKITPGSPEMRATVDNVLSKEEPLLTTSDGTRIVKAYAKDGYSIGVAAIAPREEKPGAFRLAGLFTGCTLCVNGPERGRGIGKALVMARFILDGDLPTWEHDTPGYSPAGAGVIEDAASDLAEIASYLLGKIDREPDAIGRFSMNISLEEPTPCP